MTGYWQSILEEGIANKKLHTWLRFRSNSNSCDLLSCMARMNNSRKIDAGVARRDFGF